jgi:hypothetical protein
MLGIGAVEIDFSHVPLPVAYGQAQG